MGSLGQKILGIILIIAGVFLPVDFLIKIIIIGIGGLLAGIIGFVIAIAIILFLYFKIF